MKNFILGLVAFLCVTISPAFASGCLGSTTPLQTGIVTVSTIDSAPTNGTIYAYQVTAVNNGVETGCSNYTLAVIPATGTHTVSLTWVDSCTTCTYNLYRMVAPPVPVSVTGIVN